MFYLKRNIYSYLKKKNIALITQFNFKSIIYFPHFKKKSYVYIRSILYQFIIRSILRLVYILCVYFKKLKYEKLIFKEVKL